MYYYAEKPSGHMVFRTSQSETAGVKAARGADLPVTKGYVYFENGEFVESDKPSKLPLVVEYTIDTPPSDEEGKFCIYVSEDGEKYHKLDGTYTSKTAASRLLPGLSIVFEEVYVVKNPDLPREPSGRADDPWGDENGNVSF